MAIKSWRSQHRNGRRRRQRGIIQFEQFHDVSLATRCVVVNTNYIVTSFGNNYCVNQTNYHHHRCVRRPKQKHQYVRAQHSPMVAQIHFSTPFHHQFGLPMLDKTFFFHICLSMENCAFSQIESEWTVTSNTISKHRTNFGYFNHFHIFFIISPNWHDATLSNEIEQSSIICSLAQMQTVLSFTSFIQTFFFFVEVSMETINN